MVLRFLSSGEINFPVFSARYKRIAPDSKTEMLSPPSIGLGSMIAGIRLLGEKLRNSLLNCSPVVILTGMIR